MTDSKQNPTRIDKIRGSKIFRIALVYPVVGWILIQIANETFPHLNLPEWATPLVVVFVMLGYPLALILAWANHSERNIQDDNPTDPVAVSNPHSIAVLPFVDMTPESDQTYFCEGMAEEIINALANVSDLQVASRTSSFGHECNNADIREIATALSVGTILEGSVRKSGKQLRVTAQLIDASSGYHLWSEKFDRDISDIFAIQDEIAKNVVSALQIALSPHEQAAIEFEGTCTPEAYDHFLKGRHYFHRLGHRSQELARLEFEKAIENCQSYAPAYAGLADSLSYIYMFSDANEEYARLAEENAQKALDLDPQSAEAHAAMGLAMINAKRYEVSEASLKRSVELNPRLFESHYYYARLLQAQGDTRGSVQEFEKAALLSPRDAQSKLLLVGLYTSLGDTENSQKSAREGIKIAQDHLKRHPDDSRIKTLMGSAYVVLGEIGKAEQIAENILQVDPTSDNLYNVACFYATIGNHDKALDLLERSRDRLWGANHDWVKHDPDLAVLHGNPRFEAYLKRLE
jgi:adenylate cyclase